MREVGSEVVFGPMVRICNARVAQNQKQEDLCIHFPEPSVAVPPVNASALRVVGCNLLHSHAQ